MPTTEKPSSEEIEYHLSAEEYRIYKKYFIMRSWESTVLCRAFEELVKYRAQND